MVKLKMFVTNVHKKITKNKKYDEYLIIINSISIFYIFTI